MIKSQRKAHRMIWGLIALVLPVLMVLAVTRMPSAPKASRDWKQMEAPIGTVLAKAQNEFLKLQVRGSGAQVQQLEVQVIEPLPAASALLYVGNSDLLGQLGGTGTYFFAIDQKPNMVWVQDVLKNQEITKIEL